MTETALRTLATFVTETPVARHPAVAIARAKNAFLDTIGCMYLGADASSVAASLGAVQMWGQGSAPVVGTHVTLPPPWAALANGASAHAFDLDDYTLQANDHASAVVVPAVLAAAQRQDAAYSGVDLLDAYLIGLEVIFRMGEAVNMGHYKLGWHTTSTIDSLGATAAVSRLWKLSAPQVVAALSLTTSMGSGYVSQFGTDGKPLHAGFSSKTGLVASGLAQAGASAYDGALDGDVSFRTLLVPDGNARFAESFAKLGQPWGIEEFGLGAKVYPSCGYTHRCIDASVELHNSLGITSSEEVVSATASLPDFYLAILPFHVPKDRTEALFSTAYCVAVGLVTGHNRIADFYEDVVQRPDLQALTARVDVSARSPVHPEINLDPSDPDEVTVTLKDGRTGSAKIDIWTGSPGKDISDEGFDTKFLECVELARAKEPGSSLSDGIADRVLSRVRDLDQASSIQPLMQALADKPA